MQIPNNLDEPAHRIMCEVAADGPWAEKLRDAAEVEEPPHPGVVLPRTAVTGASAYVWRTTYHHPLNGAGAVVERAQGPAEPVPPRCWKSKSGRGFSPATRKLSKRRTRRSPMERCRCRSRGCSSWRREPHDIVDLPAHRLPERPDRDREQGDVLDEELTEHADGREPSEVADERPWCGHGGS